MSSIPSVLKRPPRFSVQASLLRQGFVLSTSWEHEVLAWPPGTSRDDVKSGRRPVIALTPRQVQVIQERAQTEEELLLSVHSVAEKGSMPDPLQDRIEAAAAEKTRALQEEVAALRRTLEAVVQIQSGKAPLREEAEGDAAADAAPARRSKKSAAVPGAPKAEAEEQV